MLRLTPSDFYTFFRPQKCENRIYLRHKGLEEALPSPYEEVIRRLGKRHEHAHLSSFPRSFWVIRIINLNSTSYEQARQLELRSGIFFQMRRRSQFS
jgi:hypothetical protein